MSRNTIDAIRFECYKTDKKLMAIMPTLLLFLGIFTRHVSGSPQETLHFIDARELVPPSWLTVLLFSASYIVAGLSLGLTLGNRLCGCGEKKYQSAMWFILSLALGYVWYPLFFCARLFLVSIIVTALCLFCSLCASVCMASVSRSAFCLAIVYDAWLIYLFLLNLQVFFSI